MIKFQSTINISLRIHLLYIFQTINDTLKVFIQNQFIIIFDRPRLVDSKGPGAEFNEGQHRITYEIKDKKGSKDFCSFPFEVKGKTLVEVSFYTPVFRRDVLWYGDVRPCGSPSVRLSVRPSVRPGLHPSARFPHFSPTSFDILS